MAYELVWSAEAGNDLRTIVIYLRDNWSLQSSNKFIERTFKKLIKLAHMPTVARPSSQPSIYIYKLDRKNALFFSIEENFIVLLSIYPYRKDISKSKYY